MTFSAGVVLNKVLISFISFHILQPTCGGSPGCSWKLSLSFPGKMDSVCYSCFFSPPHWSNIGCYAQFQFFHVFFKLFPEHLFSQMTFCGRDYFSPPVCYGRNTVRLTSSGAEAVSSVGVKYATPDLHNDLIADHLCRASEKISDAGSWRIPCTVTSRIGFLINRSQICHDGMLF